MKINLNIDKRILIIISAFVVLFIILTVAFLVVNNNDKQSTLTNPGGTGGDYTPPSTVIVKNSGVFYTYIGKANTAYASDIVNKAVLYNISVSNDPKASSDYVQVDKLVADSAKLYNKDKSYVVTIDDNKAQSINSTPWNYRFLLTVDDGRHFRLDTNVNPENKNHTYTILKIN